MLEVATSTGLAKVFHEHDVGFVEFGLAEDKGFAIGRACQKEETGLSRVRIGVDCLLAKSKNSILPWGGKSRFTK